MTQQVAPPTPARVMGLGSAFIGSRALIAAVQLDLFSLVAQGVRTPDGLASHLGASPRGVRMLVEALLPTGLLQRESGELRLAPDAERYLVRSSPASLADLLLHQVGAWDRWGALDQAVRTGRPAGQAPPDMAEFFSGFVGALHNLNFPAAQAAARHLAPEASHVLDVGAGSGVWSLAFARANPAARVTMLDLPAVLEAVARPTAQRDGIADRVEFLGGDFHQLDLGDARYDLAILGHILHGEGEEGSRELLRRLHGALRTGGAVLVAEMVPDEEREKDPLALGFALNMLLHTPDGDVFTRSQLEEMGRQAGFPRAEWLPVPAPHPLLILRKA